MVATSCNFVEIESHHESAVINKTVLASENFIYMFKDIYKTIYLSGTTIKRVASQINDVLQQVLQEPLKNNMIIMQQQPIHYYS